MTGGSQQIEGPVVLKVIGGRSVVSRGNEMGTRLPDRSHVHATAPCLRTERSAAWRGLRRKRCAFVKFTAGAASRSPRQLTRAT